MPDEKLIKTKIQMKLTSLCLICNMIKDDKNYIEMYNFYSTFEIEVAFTFDAN